MPALGYTFLFPENTPDDVGGSVSVFGNAPDDVVSPVHVFGNALPQP